MLNLPANFETYAEARKSGFMKMKEIKDNGGRIVGVYCSFVLPGLFRVFRCFWMHKDSDTPFPMLLSLHEYSLQPSFRKSITAVPSNKLLTLLNEPLKPAAAQSLQACKNLS